MKKEDCTKSNHGLYGRFAVLLVLFNLLLQFLLVYTAATATSSDFQIGFTVLRPDNQGLGKFHITCAESILESEEVETLGNNFQELKKYPSDNTAFTVVQRQVSIYKGFFSKSLLIYRAHTPLYILYHAWKSFIS
ncbi:MAG: hypothetical protein ACK4EX_03500 [Thermaurantimonas sp.]|uniref:hypothetical protein n=1 Tax=Thermaurantimonas sp. TaxID=2681568 RepID=UPI00391DBA7D